MLRAVAIASVVLAGSIAEANPPGLTPSEPTAAPTAATGLKSYGTQTLLADGIAVGLLLYAVDSDDHRSEDIAVLSVGTYLFGAPLVHVMKGRTGHGLASFTMRVGFPLLGGIIGDGLHSRTKCADTGYESCADDGGDEAVMGVIAGIIAASAIDALYLAKGDPPKPQPAPLWSPSVRGTQGGFALGVRGRF